MEIYRLNAFDPEEGCMVSWHATKADAEALREELKASGHEVQDIEIMQVPLDETGLLNWLNIHFRRRHG